MVKNKALPDSARPCKHPRLVIWSFSLSLSPSQSWPYQGWSHVSSLSLSPTPFIPRVSPGSCRGWTPAAMVFPVVMYGCESWTIKKAEHWRIVVFELWCWRLLRVPWTARRSNQSILKEISRGCSLGGLMLKLKLQYFGHLMRKVGSFEKTLMLRKIEGRRSRGQQRIRWLDNRG